MNTPKVPRIFSSARREARSRRASAHQRGADAARFIWDDIADDMIERLSFVRQEPQHSLVIGHSTQALSKFLTRGDAVCDLRKDIDLEAPYQTTGHDFIAVPGLLDAVNDLPGALIHIRNALVPNGLAIASFVGGASLPRLRAAMFAAEPDRPAARLHPMVDPRAAPQLLQRAGWKDSVVDTHTLTVRYPSLDQLVQDLRDQGLGNALSDAAPPLGKAAFARARAAFLAAADADGKTSETFEIITLTGRRSLSGT
jgi:hypothetical protein